MITGRYRKLPHLSIWLLESGFMLRHVAGVPVFQIRRPYMLGWYDFILN